jgi:hypothetical protein
VYLLGEDDVIGVERRSWWPALGGDMMLSPSATFGLLFLFSPLYSAHLSLIWKAPEL